MAAPRRSSRLSESLHNRKQKVADTPPSRSSGSDPSTINPFADELKTMPSVIRSRQKGCVTRPPNAFMLFRSDFWAKEKLKDEPIERDHRDISRIAAICWNELDEEIKAVYRKKAEEQKKLHRLQHPEYRFSPIRQETVTRRKRRLGKSSRVEVDRCKRLALQVMAESEERDSPWQCAEAGADGLRPTPEEVKGTLVVYNPDIETIDEHAICWPATSSINTSPLSPLMTGKMGFQVEQAIIYDVVDPQFGQKPLLEQYIPETRFWHTLRSPQGQIPYDATEEQTTPDDEIYRRTAVVQDLAGKRPSVLAGDSVIVDADTCNAELDKYFQFDNDDES